MARGRKRQNKSTRERTTKKLKNDIHQAVLEKICKELHESSERNLSKKPYSSVAKIVKDMETDFPWMNRGVVNYAFKIYKEKMNTPDSGTADNEGRTSASENTENDLVAATSQKKCGLPVGTTLINKLKKRLRLVYVLTRLPSSIKICEKMYIHLTGTLTKGGFLVLLWK